jgi:acyl-CoA synthetase (AMP-forming)/AMP-acid ligase II
VTGPGLLDHLDRAASGDSTVHLLRTGESVRWSALWADAGACAGWIERALPGVQTVAGLLEPTRECLVVLLGTWLAGRTFASLPAPGRGMGAEEYLAQLRALVALAEAGVVVAPLDGGDRGGDLRTLGYQDFGRARAASGADCGRLVQFTSGSTDRPRGVVLDMAQVGAHTAALAQRVEVGPGDVFFSWLPLSHDMGLIGMGLTPFASMDPALGGAREVWLSDPLRFMRSPLTWLRLASDVGGSITAAPTFALDLVIRRLASAPPGLDLSSVRCLIIGSETVEAATLRRFATVAAPHGFREIALCPAYGLAEATLVVTIVPPSTPWSTGPEDGGPVALGPPVDGTDVRVRTTTDGRDQIEIRGACVAHTFLGRPARHSDDGWLQTGDLGFLHDGSLYFTGRSSDRLVVRGRNIDADSLQRRVAEVPGVRAGCCAVIADGDDGFSVVIEPAGGHDQTDMGRLCRAVADAAARWSGVSPGRVCVVGRGTLPKTPSGKLQRQRLRGRLADQSIVPLAEASGLRSTIPHPTDQESPPCPSIETSCAPSW